jgi:hypothetical protein
MKGNCEEILDRVRHALLSSLKVEPYETGCEVTLPLLDRYNDPLRVYVYREGHRVVFTDYGTALDRLKETGIDLSSRRQELVFLGILRSNGVEENKGVLSASVETDENRTDEFGRRFRLFVHAISEVAEMETMADPKVGLDFEEVVSDYLTARDVPYQPRISVPAYGIEQATVNFVLYGEVLMDSIQAAEVASANQVLNRIIVDFENIRRAHPKEYRLAAVYNDQSAVRQSSRFGLLPDVLDIAPIAWSERDERFEEIAESVRG